MQPATTADKDHCFKYPFLSSELFNSDIPGLISSLFEYKPLKDEEEKDGQSTPKLCGQITGEKVEVYETEKVEEEESIEKLKANDDELNLVVIEDEIQPNKNNENERVQDLDEIENIKD